MSVRVDFSAGPAPLILTCDHCGIEAGCNIFGGSKARNRLDWGFHPDLAGWIDVTCGSSARPTDTFHFCSQEHAAAWRAGKGKRRKIARAVEYGAEVKEIEL
jgi:hypothetical protein